MGEPCSVSKKAFPKTNKSPSLSPNPDHPHRAHPKASDSTGRFSGALGQASVSVGKLPVGGFSSGPAQAPPLCLMDAEVLVYFICLCLALFSSEGQHTMHTHLLHHMEQAAEPNNRTSSDALICTDTHKNFTRHQIITGRGQPPIRLSRSVLKWI